MRATCFCEPAQCFCSSRPRVSVRHRGAGKAKPFSRCTGIRVLPPRARIYRLQVKGRQSADRRISNHGRATPADVAICKCLADESNANLRTLICLRGRASSGTRSPLGALRRLLSQRPNAVTQSRPCFTPTAARGRYPRRQFALKRSTPRAGRTAGGSDARTTRERGYKPRPQEPHSPHPTAVTGRRP